MEMLVPKPLDLPTHLFQFSLDVSDVLVARPDECGSGVDAFVRLSGHVLL